MSTKQQDEQHSEQNKPERQRRLAVISKYVMHTLGQPADLQQVQVRQVWEDHYRVNVLLGADTTSVRVAHSYFLVTDGEGNVLASTPQVRKKY